MWSEKTKVRIWEKGMTCEVCTEKHEEEPVDCKCACHGQKPKLKTMRDFEMYQMFGNP